MHVHFTGLWKNTDFVKLWAGKTISDTGNGITGVALPLTAILVLSATPVQMGMLSALSGASVLLFSLFAGVWVDRLRQRPILIITDLGRAVLLCTIPLAALLGILRIEHLYIVAALLGILTVFFTIADQSFLPSLVQQKDLVEGNSKLGISGSIAEISGPAIAGPLVQLVGAPLAIFFDAASFLCSSLLVGLIRKPELLLTTDKEQQNIWQEIIKGMRFVLGNPLLRVLTLSTGTFEFFGNFIGTLYILYITRVLGAAPIFVGFLVATGGISALLGAFIAERIVKRAGLGRTIGASLCAYGVVGLLIPLAQGPIIVAVTMLFVAQLIGDILVEIYLVAEISLRQSIIPHAIRGRANASMYFLTRGAAPVGALIAGGLGTFIGIRLTILIGVFGIIAASLWLLFSPVYGIRSIIQHDGKD